MVNLLNRKDRSSMYNSLEVRVPFADYRIVDYEFNLPVDVKFLGGIEKRLLRKALVGILPNEIIYKKGVHIQRLIILYILKLFAV